MGQSKIMVLTRRSIRETAEVITDCRSGLGQASAGDSGYSLGNFLAACFPVVDGSTGCEAGLLAMPAHTAYMVS